MKKRINRKDNRLYEPWLTYHHVKAFKCTFKRAHNLQKNTIHSTPDTKYYSRWCI